MRLLSLAARNLLRNKRRTGITLVAIAVGLGFMLYTATLVRGISEQALEAGVATQTGHVVLQAPGWQDERKVEQLVHGVSALVPLLESTLPDATVAPRIHLGGMLVSPSSSARVALEGLDPTREMEVQELHERVSEGQWLGSDDQEIVLGSDLADRLEVGVGDKVVLMGQFGTEEMTSRLFRVRGTYHSGAAAVDGRVAFTHLAATQELLGGGDVAHQVTVHLSDSRRAEATAELVQARVGREDVQVLTWRQALPDLITLLLFTTLSTDMLVAVMGFIATFGVLNTVLMSTLERTREFGVMRALGLRPAQIRRLVLLEGLLLGMAGALAGLALGSLLSWYLVSVGMDYAAMGQGETMEAGGVVIDSLIMGHWDPPRMVAYSLAAVLLCVVAALWPAWSISRLSPVQALRHH